MRIEITDADVRALTGVSRSRSNIMARALLGWLYDDPRFGTAREIMLGRLLVQRLSAQIQKGEYDDADPDGT